MSQDKEENHLIEERRKKLAELREANKAFPNDFKRKHLAQELKNEIIIKVVATDPLATADFEHYCKQSGYEFLESYNENEKIIIRYRFKNY